MQCAAPDKSLYLDNKDKESKQIISQYFLKNILTIMAAL
jgi:hypothetical protein